jgi:hypothetical protein
MCFDVLRKHFPHVIDWILQEKKMKTNDQHFKQWNARLKIKYSIFQNIPKQQRKKYIA